MNTSGVNYVDELEGGSIDLRWIRGSIKGVFYDTFRKE